MTQDRFSSNRTFFREKGAPGKELAEATLQVAKERVAVVKQLSWRDLFGLPSTLPCATSLPGRKSLKLYTTCRQWTLSEGLLSTTGLILELFWPHFWWNYMTQILLRWSENHNGKTVCCWHTFPEQGCPDKKVERCTGSPFLRSRFSIWSNPCLFLDYITTITTSYR